MFSSQYLHNMTTLTTQFPYLRYVRLSYLYETYKHTFPTPTMWIANYFRILGGKLYTASHRFPNITTTKHVAARTYICYVVLCKLMPQNEVLQTIIVHSTANKHQFWMYFLHLSTATILPEADGFCCQFDKKINNCSQQSYVSLLLANSAKEYNYLFVNCQKYPKPSSKCIKRYFCYVMFDNIKKKTICYPTILGCKFCF